ncbi:hypothetical protein NWE53_06260 [Bosea sp. NBC_00550]|nr:hypothetical protein [Bosea sp. NBC_00550]UZF93793.1 hypothetical protein NWE53_06260 [Bosea sp. NBC_00550]
MSEQPDPVFAAIERWLPLWAFLTAAGDIEVFTVRLKSQDCCQLVPLAAGRVYRHCEPSPGCSGDQTLDAADFVDVGNNALTRTNLDGRFKAKAAWAHIDCAAGCLLARGQHQAASQAHRHATMAALIWGSVARPHC